MKKVFISKIKENNDQKGSKRSFKRKRIFYKSIKSGKLKKRISNKKKYFNFSKKIIITLVILIIIFSLFSIIIKKFRNITDIFKTHKINSYKNNDNLHKIYNNKLINHNITNIYLNVINNKTNNLSDYDIKASEIYSTYGYLSFNKLDEIYYGNKIDDTKFNHIHISMSFNNNYYLLTSVTLASLLENASNTTFIHIHIIAVDNFIYPAMKKLNSIKYKINNNCEFIFYNGKEAQDDFGLHTTKEERGLGEYARLLSLKIINDTDRLLIIDSADLIIKKDLLELYNYPLDDLLFKGIIDPFIPCERCIFYHKPNFINGGVILANLKRCKEMNIYQHIIEFYKSFNYKSKFCTPYQDILNHFVPVILMDLLPLRYNMQGYVEINPTINLYKKLLNRKCSLFYGKENEVFEEEKNLVIRHLNHFKPYRGHGYHLKGEWKYYANKTGFYGEICRKYPKGC